MMKNRLTKGLLIAALGLVECTTTKLETRSDSSVSMQDEYAGLTREQIAELEIKKNNAEATRALIDEARAKQGVLLTSDDIVCGFNSSSGFLYQDAFKRMLTTHFPAQPSAEARIVLGNGYVFTPDGRVYDLGQLVDTKRWGSSYDVLCQTVYPKRDPIDITDKLKKYDPNLQKALDSMILEKIRTEKDKAKEPPVVQNQSQNTSPIRSREPVFKRGRYDKSNPSIPNLDIFRDAERKKEEAVKKLAYAPDVITYLQAAAKESTYIILGLDQSAQRSLHLADNEVVILGNTISNAGLIGRFYKRGELGNGNRLDFTRNQSSLDHVVCGGYNALAATIEEEFKQPFTRLSKESPVLTALLKTYEQNCYPRIE